MLCPRNTRSSSKSKRFVAMKKVNPFRLSAKNGTYRKAPLQDKLATLERFYNEMSDLYSVHELCEALDVSRGTFYNHIFRRAD